MTLKLGLHNAHLFSSRSNRPIDEHWWVCGVTHQALEPCSNGWNEQRTAWPKLAIGYRLGNRWPHGTKKARCSCQICQRPNHPNLARTWESGWSPPQLALLRINEARISSLRDLDLHERIIRLFLEALPPIKHKSGCTRILRAYGADQGKIRAPIHHQNGRMAEAKFQFGMRLCKVRIHMHTHRGCNQPRGSWSERSKNFEDFRLKHRSRCSRSHCRVSQSAKSCVSHVEYVVQTIQLSESYGGRTIASELGLPNREGHLRRSLLLSFSPLRHICWLACESF